MLISKQWLQDHLDLTNVTPEEIAKELTLKTVEVEGLVSGGELLDNVVFGKVTSIEKHPDADRLNVCQVDVGNDTVQIVCGGSNVTAGMNVALGKIGAHVLWHGEGEPVELKKTKIRGVVSLGMICAAEEIGLGEMFPSKDEKGILDLSHIDAKVGTPVKDLLGLNDIVFDIDNKSMTHRPDLWGHYGIARELSGMFGKKLAAYKPSKIKKGRSLSLSVDVQDSVLCPRYMAVALENIKIAPSPQWMQQRLLAVGIRPINNIVDITNYVMLDVGQPMHAFDANKLASAEIFVRTAEKNEKIETLDGQTHKLNTSDLVIADKEKAVAIAGVMGGSNSEVDDRTTSIIFESANFDATAVRKTSTRLALRSDSSSRFEKSLDPNVTELALKRAVELVKEIIPEAKTSSNVVDVSSFELNQGPIEVPLTFIISYIGAPMEKKAMVQILESLGFSIKVKKETLYVTVPTWRATKDVSTKEDVVEEIARMYGFDNIAPSLPTFSITPPQVDPVRKLERELVQQLAMAQRFTQVKNYSFISEQNIVNAGLATEKYLSLDNPIAKDRPYLRRHLIPNLLEAVEKNGNRYDEVRLFETGRVYRKEQDGEPAQPGKKDKLPGQSVMLGMAFTAKGDTNPFAVVSDALRAVAKVEIGTSEHKGPSFVHPGRHAAVFADGHIIGGIAEIHPSVQQSFGIDNRIAIVEINLSMLATHVKDESGYSHLSQYPSITRDIAFVTGSTTEHASVVTEIQKIDELVTSVELFDVFEGKKLGEGKKSMAYHITFQSADRTLEATEVDAIMKKIESTLTKKFDAEVR
jgi:phenylalanyl-tRNA synthetase beta chain